MLLICFEHTEQIVIITLLINPELDQESSHRIAFVCLFFPQYQSNPVIVTSVGKLRTELLIGNSHALNGTSFFKL